MLALIPAGIFLFLLHWAMLRRKKPLMGTFEITVLIIALFLLIPVLLKYSYLGNRYQGVVVEQEAEVRYGPSFNDQLAFRLVEGLKVMINDSKEDWYRITLNDGQSGWILKSKVEPI